MKIDQRELYLVAVYNLSGTLSSGMTVMEAEMLCAAEGSTLATVQWLNESHLIGSFINQTALLSNVFVANNMRYENTTCI